MKTPVIEYRRFQHSARASQETNQFTADLFINGKKVGFVQDEGNGGAAWCRWDSDTAAEKALLKEYLAALQPWESEWQPEGGKWDDEFFFASLCEAYIDHADKKKRCGTHFCFKLKTHPRGQFFTQKFSTKKDDPRRAAEVTQLKASAIREYGDNIEEIYNDRDFSKIPVVADAKLREDAMA